MTSMFNPKKPQQDPEIARRQAEQDARLKAQEEKQAAADETERKRKEREDRARRDMGRGLAAVLSQSYTGFKPDEKLGGGGKLG